MANNFNGKIVALVTLLAVASFELVYAPAAAIPVQSGASPASAAVLGAIKAQVTAPQGAAVSTAASSTTTSAPAAPTVSPISQPVSDQISALLADLNNRINVNGAKDRLTPAQISQMTNVATNVVNAISANLVTFFNTNFLTTTLDKLTDAQRAQIIKKGKDLAAGVEKNIEDQVTALAAKQSSSVARIMNFTVKNAAMDLSTGISDAVTRAIPVPPKVVIGALAPAGKSAYPQAAGSTPGAVVNSVSTGSAVLPAAKK